LPTAEKPKTAAKPKKPKAKQPPAPKVSDEDREERRDKATDREKVVLGYVRKNGSIDAGQAGELLGLTPEGARLVLQKLSSRTPLQRFELVPGSPRQGVEWRLTASKGADDGPKTSVEVRVVDSVTTDGPIDEGTLAFNCNLSITDCRSVTSGLVRRGVLSKREEEGVTLFEVPS
jgi:hypothetical protein